MVVALALAVSTAALLGRSWNTCDIGVNNAANGTFLVLLFVPGLWALLLLAWGAVSALAGHRPAVHACALGVTLLAVAWCAVSVFWGATPSPMCPDGTPPWWPEPVPAPGF
ncbi:hypothetical protein ACFWNK_13625 [Streptomyces sp. NPDC058417]|uniref:hypothetical protein n=1 Tax=unclassified Streptomyces TaxID=2593676 RepID=UPI003661BA37